MASLIEDALCFGDADIYFGPGDVSWTMGAALVEGKALWFPEAQPRSLTPKISKVILSPIFLFVLLIYVSLRAASLRGRKLIKLIFILSLCI